MSLKKKAATSLVWTFTQQFGNQLIGFVISIILARILLPEEFGLIGMIAVFMALGNSIIQGGLGTSLIRTEELDNGDYSTVFYYNLITSICLYLLIYFLSPFIANFYDRPVLQEIIRVYSISFIIAGLSMVQVAQLTKKMNFRVQSLVAIPSAIAGGTLGIVLALNGYGVWSLVWSHIANTFTHTILIWRYSGWFPELIFDYKKLRKHFNFGYKLILSELLDRIFRNIYLVVIGKFFSASQLGFYTRAESMNQLPVQNISRALDKVTFPLFVSIQNEEERLRRVYRELMKMVLFLIAPTLIFLAVMATPIFRFLFTEKWLPAVPYFQILCVTGIMFPLHSYNLDVLNVKGRSDLFLRLEITKKILIVIVLMITLPFGIKPLLYGQIFISLIAFFINARYTGTFIGYNAIQQLKDIIPILLLASTTGLVVYIIDENLFANQIDFVRLFLGSLIGGVLYLAAGRFLGFTSLIKLMNLLKIKIF